MHREDTCDLRDVLTMLKPIGENAKRERLGPGNGFISALTIDQNARQLWNLADPPAIRLPLDVHRKVAHSQMLHLPLRPSFEVHLCALRHRELAETLQAFEAVGASALPIDFVAI